MFRTKRARLNELEVQAAAMGQYNVPPQIAMEIGSLKEELGMFETAIESPIRAGVGDELGPRGRFVVNYQQNQDIKRSLAALAVQSQEWREMQRNWIILIGLVVILILVAVVALVTYLLTKGAL